MLEEHAMQTRRRFVKGGLALSAAVLAAGALPANAAGPVELAFSSWVPPTHVLMKDFMVPWGQQVEKATDGRVKIRFLPKPVTNPQGHRDAVRNGVADLAFISLSYYPGRFELMKFAMLPFSGKSAQSTSIAAWRMFDKYMHKMDDEGFLVLGLYAHGPGGVYTAKRKVEKIEDFKDLKIRIGGGMQADVAKVLNVNAIVKPAPESYELLSTGVADGVFFPPESVASFRLDGIVRYATLFPGGLYADVHAIIMNKDAFAKLSEQDKAALLTLSGEHIATMGGKAWGDADVAALESLKAKNVEFVQPSAQLISDVKARTAGFEKEWLAMAKERGVDGQAMLADFRAELARLEQNKAQ